MGRAVGRTPQEGRAIRAAQKARAGLQPARAEESYRSTRDAASAMSICVALIDRKVPEFRVESMGSGRFRISTPVEYAETLAGVRR